ncbi:DUF1653 domain-containing protein [Leisingera sp. MMG026]|uniref:DUF1653 domain-containing protein n=1 Tax=Leisingera sp. MMG026 TaxID=2909982 RepID=UPI001F2DDE71|nr:DUF1653 domain-containing protein [Leisingera sp. MMG026]MCF6432592.1 DUF1653 domain-containing protein [Leisingera sp. MMG026]
MNTQIKEMQSRIWQHIKSGGLYTVLFDDAFREHDMTKCVVYQSLWDGQVFVRPADEFLDGRFRNIAVDEVTDCRTEEERDEL